MRIDDLSAPSGSFVARRSVSVATVDRCPGRGKIVPAAGNAFGSVLPYPPRSARAPQKPRLLRRPLPSRLIFSRSSTQETDYVETTGPTVSTLVSPGVPTPPTAKPLSVPPSDRISTRTRRRTATAAGNAPPAVDYGFGPGGAPRPYVRRANTPPRVPRPRPIPLTAATPAPAAWPVPTVPLPSDHDRAEPVGTPLLRHPPPPGDTPTASTKLDALGNATE